MSLVARSGFRRILRSAKLAFAGDTFALKQASVQLKEEFLRNSDVTDKSSLKELYKGVDEVDEMLRFNIVQGQMNEKGNFNVDLATREEHRVVLESGKDQPHGVDISPIDQSSVGDADKVVLTKTKGSKAKKK